ncbi:polysaccharide deacetylase family protein [Oceanibium sediminis]|uniref:polysaccharide deacetylase family protein n=1 Tax=Oceanibium sediminis TaxID=2026339 RepID=UPI000DD48B4C|nr:polysaccharide deacetylase family protein [Oceanibium sediminis]
MTPRDLLGYGATPPDVRWPGDARVAVSFVVNFEEGAEYSVAEGDATNEAVYEVIDRLDGIPDPCIQSHFDYGTRAGWWRLAEVFDRFEAPLTLSACGLAVERTPQIAQDAVQRGHEASAHGWRWESHAHMCEEDERRNIARTIQAIEAATGQRPVGWHTRSASSPMTRRLLVEEGGFLYDSDFYGDDLPQRVQVDGKPHLLLPYAFDTNDMHFQHTDRFVRADDFAGYVIDAFEWLWREGAARPKMMSVGLHLRMIARPARMWALERILQHMRGREGVWIARRDEIARHWLDNVAP